MIVDGKKIAEGIFEELTIKTSQMANIPRMTVFACAPNFETQKYLTLKKKKAIEIGVAVDVVEMPEDISTTAFVEKIQETKEKTDGIIVQLPLPEHIDTQKILESVPTHLDIDGLNPNTTGFLSPVVGAVKSILETHKISLLDKKTVVVGSGKLVGKPVYEWCKRQKADVVQVTTSTIDIEEHIKNADIIIAGAGVPGLIKPDAIKKGVALLDAGTSEDGGELKGDIDSSCASKSSLFTPVPGGIGPVTVAVLLQNVVDSSSKR
jgi:methylenetetrahydrofolate dehydrogenase (NADP+)/methenyltetrahydrofolate cyclohydrolase